MPRRKTDAEFTEEVYELVGDEYVFLEKYVNNKTKIMCHHKTCGHKWRVQPNSFLNQGTRCPKCNGGNRMSQKEFEDKVYKEGNGKYIFLEQYVNYQTKITCRHKECGHEWKITPNDFLYKNARCPKCAGNKKKTPEEFEKEVKDLTKGEYVFLEKYISADKKITCHHKECGHEWRITPNNFLQGRRCPKCSRSKEEKRIAKYLKKHGIKFKDEFEFEDLTVKDKLRFDFAVINNNKILFLIEYDGRQHFDPNNYFHETEKSFRYGKYKDRVKTAYCINNNIPLLRISYFKKNKMEQLINEMLKENKLLKVS